MTGPPNHEQLELLRAVEVVCFDHGGWAKPSEVRQQLSRRGVLVAGASTHRVAGRLREYAEQGLLEQEDRSSDDLRDRPLRYRLPRCKHCGGGHLEVPDDLCDQALAEWEAAGVLAQSLGLTP